MIDDPVAFDRKRMGVAVIVYNFEKCEVLACQRIGCRDMNGLWQFPGGSIEFGESHPEAAQRELYEETGLQLALVRFVPIAIGIGKTPDGHEFVTEFFMVSTSSQSEPDNQQQIVNKEPEKHSPWEWLSPEELCKRELIPLAKKIVTSHFNIK